MKKEKGITLVEVLIYSFLFTLAIFLIIGILTNFLFFQGIFLTRGEVTRSIIYLLEDMAREIRQSDEIIQPEAKNSSSELLLTRENKNLSFKLKNEIVIKEVEKKSFSLTPKTLKIKSLKFSHFKQLPDAPSSIKIRLEVEYKNPLRLKEYEFFIIYQTTFTQRK
jgi:hypothetical protein